MLPSGSVKMKMSVCLGSPLRRREKSARSAGTPCGQAETSATGEKISCSTEATNVQRYCGWTKSISHHFEAMVETITFVAVYAGESFFPGFLGGA